MNSLYHYDIVMRIKHGVICGVDEAGRGPLAGPVFAAAVVFPEDIYIDGLNDSKKLTKRKREAVFEDIMMNAVSFSIARASVEEIEELNILNAALLAMKRAVEGLHIKPDCVLIDGDKLPGLDITSEAVIKGDSTSASIAAASILAKVTRDREMVHISREYPQYGFEKHKGYGTKKHYEALREHGISPVHRLSFLKKLTQP